MLVAVDVGFLQNSLAQMRAGLLDEVKRAMRTEVDTLREENKVLREELRSLSRELEATSRSSARAATGALQEDLQQLKHGVVREVQAAVREGIVESQTMRRDVVAELAQIRHEMASSLAESRAEGAAEQSTL